MQVIENEQVYCFDIDKTLVSERRREPLDGDLPVINPYTDELWYVRPHSAHVDLLKEMFGRGRHITVWSASGVKWAAAIVRTLDLEGYVHTVQTKPIGYVDDQPISEWLANRIFLPEADRK
jgi:phosphoserine phosphatase